MRLKIQGKRLLGKRKTSLPHKCKSGRSCLRLLNELRRWMTSLLHWFRRIITSQAFIKWKTNRSSVVTRFSFLRTNCKNSIVSDYSLIKMWAVYSRSRNPKRTAMFNTKSFTETKYNSHLKKNRRLVKRSSLPKWNCPNLIVSWPHRLTNWKKVVKTASL